VPDRLFRQPLSPGLPHLVYPTKQLARCNVRCLHPVVDDILQPFRHRDRAGVACLSPHVDNGLVVLPPAGGRNSAQLPHVTVGQILPDPNRVGEELLWAWGEFVSRQASETSFAVLLNRATMVCLTSATLRIARDPGIVTRWTGGRVLGFPRRNEGICSQLRHDVGVAGDLLPASLLLHPYGGEA
jgi:hypothetical protein